MAAPLQPLSALRGMKRSWSGSKQDMGAAPAAAGDHDDDVQFVSSTAPASARIPSSAGEPIPWSSSPSPELADVKRTKVEQAKSRRDENGRVMTSSASSSLNRLASSSSSSSSSSSAAKARQLPSIFAKTASQAKAERNMLRPPSRASGLFKSGEDAGQLDAFGARKTKVGKIFLSNEQRRVHDLVVRQGLSVFFTGSAGTGKSVLLREIISGLRLKYSTKTDAVAVTASTGIAACNIGGVTLHSFAGFGLGLEPVNQLVSKIRKNRKAAGRWMRTQVLIIDEISMIEGGMFDKLEEIARMLRKNDKPFGGIQVVVAGDFFQLPPVSKNGEIPFAFEAKTWNTVLKEQVNLTQVFRQKDQTFVNMLNELRFGRPSPESVRRFQQLERIPRYDEGIVPTELFPRREEVDRANQSRLNALNTQGKMYNARDGGSLPPEQRDKVLQNFMAPVQLRLKVGAQVMLIKNVDEQLVNGSIGIVCAFMTTAEYKLAHAVADLTELDERGSLKLDDEARQKLEVRKKALDDRSRGASAMQQGGPSGAEAARSRSASPVKESDVYPLVRFVVPGGHRTELVLPESWKNELPNGEVQASRDQLPLILAWAMSIHKAQGQTLPCCKIDLKRVFEKGQAYVALSRATSLEGLQIFGFDPRKVMAHEKVIRWHRTLTGGQNQQQQDGVASSSYSR